MIFDESVAHLIFYVSRQSHLESGDRNAADSNIPGSIFDPQHTVFDDDSQVCHSFCGPAIND